MVFEAIVTGYDNGNYVTDRKTDRETQMNLGF
jgi:hypothetical protein